MYRMILGLALLLASNCLWAQAVGPCAKENAAIASASAGTPMAALYRARDECNQKAANAFQVKSDAVAASNESSGTKDGLQALLSEHWEKVGSEGASTFSFNSKNVIFDRSGANVAVKTETKLAYGERTIHIDLGVLPCKPGSGVPRSFIRETTADLIVGTDGYAHPDMSLAEPMGLPPVAVDIEEGSVLDLVSERLCGSRSTESTR